MSSRAELRGQHLVRADRRFATGGGRVLGLLAPAFKRMLDKVDAGLIEGGIDATLPDGSRRRLGFRSDGPVAIVHLNSWRAMLRLATSGSVGWYKAWEKGEWDSPDPVPLFELFMRNGRQPWQRRPRQGTVAARQSRGPCGARQYADAAPSATSPRITTSAMISTPPGSILR